MSILTSVWVLSAVLFPLRASAGNYLYLLCRPLLLTTVFATVGDVYVQDFIHQHTVTTAWAFLKEGT